MPTLLPIPTSIPKLTPKESRNQDKQLPKSNRKPLLFISYDDQNSKPKALRREVSSHIRSVYQPWQRRVEARAKRAAIDDLLALNSPIPGKEDRKTSPSKDTIRRLDPSKSVTEDGPTSSKLDPWLQSGTDTACREINQNIPAPAMFHGNSDPFSSLSFEITPIIASLINFERAHLHPCIYKAGNVSRHAYGESYLSDLNRPFTNQAAVYGYLSRAATVLASASPDSNPDFAQAALVLKGKSSAALRAQLTNADEIDPWDIMRKILALLVAELFARSYDAALIHSRVVMRLLKQHSQDRNFDLRFFFSVVYSEVQRACMSLTPPCFDTEPEGWVMIVFDAVGKDAFDVFSASVILPDSPSDAGMLGVNLARIFDEVRSVRSVSQAYSASNYYATPTPLALYIPARVIVCLGKLVSYYSHGYQDDIDTTGSNKYSHTLIRRAAALAALHWARKVGHIDSIKVSNATIIYRAGPLILSEIRESMSCFNSIATSKDQKAYAQLKFWIFYIGALEEQDSRGCLWAGEHWFTSHLRSTATKLGLSSFQDARLVLEQFLYTDSIGPLRNEWLTSIFPTNYSTSSLCPDYEFAAQTWKETFSAQLAPLYHDTTAQDTTFSINNHMNLPSTTSSNSTPNTYPISLNETFDSSLSPTNTSTSFLCPCWSLPARENCPTCGSGPLM